MTTINRTLTILPITTSAAAYFLLAVPPSFGGFLSAALLTVVFYFSILFFPRIFVFSKQHLGKPELYISLALCAILGLRFRKVWFFSSLASEISSAIGLSYDFLFSVAGIFLGITAFYFVWNCLTFCFRFPAEHTRTGLPLLKWDRKLLIGLLIIASVQAVFLIVLGTQKEGFHVDEVYTFELSNYGGTNYGDSENAYASWSLGTRYRDILAPVDSSLFDLTIPYWNAETDNHPATYYLIVHILSSLLKLFGLNASKWAGLIPNIIFCAGTCIFTGLILYQITSSRFTSLAGSLSWAFSIGGLTTGVYIRMYALQTLLSVLFLYLILLMLTRPLESLSGKFCTLLQSVTVAGILSQYYFLFVAFFLCLSVCIYYVLHKRWCSLFCFIKLELLALTIAELLFPRMVVRLFFGDRGQEALTSLSSETSFKEQLNHVLQIFDRELFGGLADPILLCLTIFLVVNIVLFSKKISLKQGSFPDITGFLFIAFTTIGYICIVTKLAPFQVDRYFMCIFPWIYIAIFCVLHAFLGYVCQTFGVEDKLLNCGLCLITMVMTLVFYRNGTINYLYPENKVRQEALAPYKSLPVIAINGDTYNDSLVQWFFEFQDHPQVFLCRNTGYEDLEIAFRDHSFQNGFLLYSHYISDDTLRIISSLENFYDLSDYEILADTQNCRVFYCK
ncbi:MAG: hypothetical protein U0L91_01360 [Gemmiger sp.]|uniref:hypothetical protein n=1 Tax=Gemmiger sp. TaxID=2049027 RepID=UPI002E778530|nr:hypothetical protein [Gemmiger sp.]MEE0799907.1 hypothetical protein [Gemmiger sp.]